MPSTQDVKLNRSTLQLDGHILHFHNGIQLDEWYHNRDVDSLNKFIIDIATMYTSSDEKDPNKRVYFHNTHFKEKANLTAKHSRSTVQKSLRRARKLGLIKHFIFTDKAQEQDYIWKGGSRADWNQHRGLTKRFIVPDMNVIKAWLSTLPDDAAYIEAPKRSTFRRFVMRRIVSIKELVYAITKQQVNDVIARRKQVNSYLLKQQKQYGDFNQPIVSLDAVDQQVFEDALAHARSYIYGTASTPVSSPATNQ